MVYTQELKALCSLLVLVLSISCSNQGGSYYDYLCKAQANLKNVDADALYGESMKYWMQRVDTLREYSYRENDTLRLYLDIQETLRKERKHDCSVFANEINRFVDYDAENTILEHPVLFIGSSTANLWKTAKCFPQLKVMNRGFGGASIQDILYYYDDVIGKYSPSTVVMYDDIDIENGDSAESAFNKHVGLLDKIHNDFPECRIIFISQKPTQMDFLLGKDIRSNKNLFNEKMKEHADNTPYLEYIDLASLLYKEDGTLDLDCFSEDRMHFNDKGYELWTNRLSKLF